MPEAPFTAEFASAIYRDKYAWPEENWAGTARRVVEAEMGALYYTPASRAVGHQNGIPEAADRITARVAAREFIPGGRHLYAAGRDYHPVNNCFLKRATDSREGWAELAHDALMVLQSGGGLGVDYSEIRPAGSAISRTGGVASGPIPLAIAINDLGRAAVQGGNRRSALWGGLNWQHSDIEAWIAAKDWPEYLVMAKAEDYRVAAPLDMTNISVLLDDRFFEAYGNPRDPDHFRARRVFRKALEGALANGEPGFSVDTGSNAGETLRNPCPLSADTHVLTDGGYRQIGDLLDGPATVWTGQQWAPDVQFQRTGEQVKILAVRMTGGRTIRADASHPFLVERWLGAGERRHLDRIDRVRADALEPGDVLHRSAPMHQTPEPVSPEGYTLGWVYGDGSFTRSGGADLTLCSDESKACADGIVGFRSENRSNGRGFHHFYFSVDPYWKGRTKAEIPPDVEVGTPGFVLSFLAGLYDADGHARTAVHQIQLANKSPEFLRGVARLLERFGIWASVSKNGRDGRNHNQQYQLMVERDSTDRFINLVPTRRVKLTPTGTDGYRAGVTKVVSVEEDGIEDVYCANVNVPEHTFMAEGVIVSNCEITSRDDSDVCNLGHANIAAFDTIDDFAPTVRDGVHFLLAATLYGDLPYAKVREVREKNRRLGLGLMGMHDWLLQRGKPYGPDEELGRWLEVYAESGRHADELADHYGISRPAKTRAIAPTGTTSILAETTPGIEPVLTAAFKRRVRHSGPGGGERSTWEYVLDPSAARALARGVDPSLIEDADSLSYDVGRRLEFQAWVQGYVDHAISSTVNLPAPITDPKEVDRYEETVMRYLPRLRGVTFYPNGARAGQPIVPVPIAEAIDQVGVRYEDSGTDRCLNGICAV